VDCFEQFTIVIVDLPREYPLKTSVFHILCNGSNVFWRCKADRFSFAGVIEQRGGIFWVVIDFPTVDPTTIRPNIIVRQVEI
jgi:hypothetical protein